MANVVKLKRSAVSGKVPTTSALELGEVALNTYDGNLFFKKDDGTEAIVSVVTTDGTQTLTNKTLTDATLSNTFIFGNDIFYEQPNGFSINEDIDVASGTGATQSAYNFTALSGDDEIAISLSNGSTFRNGIGVYGDSTNNYLVSFGTNLSTNWEWRYGVGDQPIDLSGGSLRMSLSKTGDLTVTGNLILDTDAKALDLSSGAAIIDDQGSDGTSNQILTSTSTGVRWVTNSAGALSGLSDVSLSGLTQNQILKYNGTVWVNADENAVVSSAVFAANALSDLGLVTDSNITISEDLEPEHDIESQPNGLGDTDTYYNMGPIAIDGVVGLRNVDQSLKSDYVSYSIIFGF